MMAAASWMPASRSSAEAEGRARVSYILEAIRRSEEERRKRLVPGVSTIHAGPRPRPVHNARPVAVLVLAGGVALAVATVIAARSWPWSRAADETVASAETQSVAPRPAGEDAAKGVQPARPEEHALVLPPAPPQAAAPPPRPADASVPAPERAAAATAAEPGAAGEPAAAKGEKKPERRRPRTPYSATAAGDAKAVARQPKTTASRVAQPPVAAADSNDTRQNPLPVPAPAPAPAPAPEIVSAMALSDLPDTVQRALPDIAITLHRYAETASARMIRVNGRTAHEGDALTEHLSVAEITRNGVVFVIGDQRFYMDAFQNWQAKNGS